MAASRRGLAAQRLHQLLSERSRFGQTPPTEPRRSCCPVPRHHHGTATTGIALKDHDRRCVDQTARERPEGRAGR